MRERTDSFGFDRHRGLTWHGQLISDACERRAQGATLQNSVLLSRGQAAEQLVPVNVSAQGERTKSFLPSQRNADIPLPNSPPRSDQEKAQSAFSPRNGMHSIPFPLGTER